MNDDVKSCPQCGEVLTSEAPGGLCPRCVMVMNMLGDTVPGVVPGGTPAVEDLAPHFPQLEILECLGRGGMGIVYKARQPQLDRFVALKILAPERVDDVRFAERFRREALSLARLDHPNIVTVYDTGEAGGFYYLLMEFVDGLNLREAIAGEKMPPGEALAIVPPICAGLQYAHEQGVVHRDIKPENILLDRKGRVKIADFGVAKLVCGPEDVADGAGGTSEADPGLTVGDKLGTPQYMAPEQKVAAATDHRADIYAVGVVFYEMLTGERPQQDLVPPSRKVEVDVRIDEIVLRALEKEPARRYQSAREMQTVVETMAADAPPPVAPVTAPVATKRRKTPYVVAGLGCLALLLIVPLVLALVLYLSWNQTRQQEVKKAMRMEQEMMREVLEVEREAKRRIMEIEGKALAVEAASPAAAKVGNPLEGSFRGLVDGEEVERHISESQRMLRAPDAQFGRGGGPAVEGAAEAVQAYTEALRDLDVDRAYAMWAAEGEMDDRRREQMLRDAQELQTVYAQDPVKLGTITEWYREGVYAVARMAAPVGGDDMHSIFVILVAKPEGWKVVDVNDIRGEDTLKGKLDLLLDRK